MLYLIFHPFNSNQITSKFYTLNCPVASQSQWYKHFLTILFLHTKDNETELSCMMLSTMWSASAQWETHCNEKMQFLQHLWDNVKKLYCKWQHPSMKCVMKTHPGHHLLTPLPLGEEIPHHQNLHKETKKQLLPRGCGIHYMSQPLDDIIIVDKSQP